MTTLAEKKARLERIVDAIVCTDDPGDMPIDDFAWVAETLRLALNVVDRGSNLINEAYCEASDDDPNRVICPVDSLPELRDALSRFEKAD